METRVVIENLKNAVIAGEIEQTQRWCEETLKGKIDPLLAIEEGIRKGLELVGLEFKNGTRWLPELVIAGEAAMAGTQILEKAVSIVDSRAVGNHLVVIGTVSGDVHNIGKNLVATLLRADGFSVIDIGVNVTSEKFVEAVEIHQPSILALSSLLTTTVPEQEVVIQALLKAGLRDRVKVMVGGGAVTQDWADEIGADAYDQDAAGAVEKGKMLVE